MELDNPTSVQETEVMISDNMQIQLDGGDDSNSILNTETTNDNPEDNNGTSSTTGVNQSNTENNIDNTDGISNIQTEVDKNEKVLAAVKNDLKAKGVDLNKAIKEYNSTGTLSSQTIADLMNAGYPSEVVEGFIASRQALEEKFTNEVYKLAGGEQEYQKLTQWASANLPKKVVDTFNKAIDNNNLEALSLMLEGIKSKYTATYGTRNPSIIGNASSAAPKANGFTSKEEVIKAFSDPRYGRDPQYMREMELKMFNTAL